MRKITKVFLIIALCLVGVGVLLCGAAIALGYSGNFGITTDLKYVDLNNTVSMPKTVVTPFTGIDLNVAEDDVELIAGDGYYIECENVVTRPEFEVGGDGILRLSAAEGEAETEKYLLLLNRFSLSLGSASAQKGKIRIYCPAGAVMSGVNANIDFGDVSVSNLSCDRFSLKTGYGDAEISRLTATSADIDSDCGDISAAGLNISDLAVNSSYGDISINGLDVGALKIESAVGDTELKDFAVTGSVDINADFGDVELSPRGGIDGYVLDLNTDFGDVTVMGRDYGESTKSLYMPDGIPVRVYADSGDIDVE